MIEECARAAAKAALMTHHQGFFAGHDITVRRWHEGPASQRLPAFFVHEVGPGPRYSGWTYLSVGAWSVVHDHQGHGLEFLVSAPRADPLLVELITMSVYYHAGPPQEHLDIGHTVPIGRPWLPGSPCDHLLVGLPYVFGPELEVCSWPGGDIRILELLPITKTERDYKAFHGAEALEQRLEEASAHTSDPLREPVI